MLSMSTERSSFCASVNPVTAVTVRYKWLDANHDTVVQPGEIFDGNNVALLSGGNPASFLFESGNWDPANPGSPTTRNTIDPNLKNDSTHEVIIGADREVGAGFAVGANYIWRRYYNCFSNACPGWSPLNGISVTGSDYAAVAFTPTAGSCPTGATCPTLTYFQPLFQLGTISTEMNIDNFNRTFNGLELNARKRLSNRWLMNTSYAYNSTIVNYGAGSFQDPTNIAARSGFQYDFLTSGSGIGNVFVNAKWLFKLSGMYQLPLDVNVSAFYNARQGYPFERTITSPSRANGAGTASLLIDNVGENRLPNYQNLDFHVERPIKVNNIRLVPAIDLFNVFNWNTEQAIRGVQNSSNANAIQAIVAPRVARFGVRVTW